MPPYAQRRKKVLSLAEGKAVVAATGANLFYLTGFWGGGAGVVYSDKTVVITSPLEARRVGELGHEVEVKEVRTWAEVSSAVVKEAGSGGAVIDDYGTISPGRGAPERRPELFLEARRKKDRSEVERIQKASEKVDEIYAALPGLLRPGVSEWEVGAEVMKLATERMLTPSGSDSGLAPIIIASGENGSFPHCELSARRLKEGDFVVADIFFRFEGYNTDQTRTFAVGRASPEMKKAYGAVLEAQGESMATMSAGTTGRDAHEAALKVLRKHGLEERLNHGVGHGVGIDIHEPPGISRLSRDTLSPDDVVTCEPGVYFPGRFGVRIEDTLLVGSKPSPLTRSPRGLVVCR